MIRILLSGCNGKMGNVISRAVLKRDDCKIVAGIDINNEENDNFAVFDSPERVNVEADVIIDFSNPKAFESLLSFAIDKKLPVVFCTTGFSKDQVKKIKDSSKLIPIFYSRNMSLGINLIIELSKRAMNVLGDNFDVEIIEKHHNQKIDAPSGTALMIADEIAAESKNNLDYVYDRRSYRKSRSKNEIGIHSIRGGTIVGDHEIIFAGHDEIVKISHSAQSKEVFALGSINAAIFICKKPASLYNMSDLLDE